MELDHMTINTININWRSVTLALTSAQLHVNDQQLAVD